MPHPAIHPLPVTVGFTKLFQRSKIHINFNKINYYIDIHKNSLFMNLFKHHFSPTSCPIIKLMDDLWSNTDKWEKNRSKRGFMRETMKEIRQMQLRKVRKIEGKVNFIHICTINTSS